MNKKWFEKKQADKTWISSGTCWFRLCDFLILLGNLDPLPGNCVFWVPLVKFDIFLDFDFCIFVFRIFRLVNFENSVFRLSKFTKFTAHPHFVFPLFLKLNSHHLSHPHHHSSCCHYRSHHCRLHHPRL